MMIFGGIMRDSNGHFLAAIFGTVQEVHLPRIDEALGSRGFTNADVEIDS